MIEIATDKQRKAGATVSGDGAEATAVAAVAALATSTTAALAEVASEVKSLYPEKATHAAIASYAEEAEIGFRLPLTAGEVAADGSDDSGVGNAAYGTAADAVAATDGNDGSNGNAAADGSNGGDDEGQADVDIYNYWHTRRLVLGVGDYRLVGSGWVRVIRYADGVPVGSEETELPLSLSVVSASDVDEDETWWNGVVVVRRSADDSKPTVMLRRSCRWLWWATAAGWNWGISAGCWAMGVSWWMWMVMRWLWGRGMWR